MKRHILLVDDDNGFRRTLALVLRDQYEIQECESGEEAIAKLEEYTPDAVLLDIDFGPKRLDGLEVLTKIKSIDPLLPVFMISKLRDLNSVVRAMKLGADDYIGKSPDVEELDAMISRALNGKAQRRELGHLRDRLNQAAGGYIGQNVAVEQVRQLIRQAAPTDSTVLITGETGTGKDLVARELHRLSGRADKPFVVVSLPDLPEQLFESEIFGHERGAFTGATGKKAGCFEIADGGTLFLDEIGDLPTHMQVKLLRVIETHEFRRVGGMRSLAADVRIIAATNRNMEDLVKDGSFRKDLYYRLHVFPIELPPLREHLDDIPVLAAYYLEKKIRGRQNNPPMLSKETMKQLMNYSWPGNVRELFAVLEAACIRTTGTEITPDKLMFGRLADNAPSEVDGNIDYEAALQQFRLRYFTELLKREGGKVADVARCSGIQRPSLYKIFSTLGLDPADFRELSDS